MRTAASATRAASRPSDAPTHLGQAIRELRRAQGLTLVQLAERCGRSHPFLSQIERGQARPSMQTLFEVSRALGTTQDRLLASTAEHQPQDTAPLLLRGGTGLLLAPTGDGDGEGTPSGGAARHLVAENSGLAVIEFTGLPHAFGDFWYQHEASELAYVATGQLEVELGDGTVHLLDAGDALRYPGHVPHRWRARGRRATRVLMIHGSDTPWQTA